jgi:hypothetical protein
VVTHARTLLTCLPPGRVDYVHADLADPASVLAAPEVHRTLDLNQPVGLLLVAVLHFLADDDQPGRIVDHLAWRLPPGSFVVISHAAFDLLPAETARHIGDLARTGAHGTFRLRTREEIAGFCGRLSLIEPGLVPVVDWRPDLAPKPEAAASDAAVYAAVGRVQ